MLIEIHLSQIRIPDSKREKVCAVCPYLLFITLMASIKYKRFVSLMIYTFVVTKIYESGTRHKLIVQYIGDRTQVPWKKGNCVTS